MSWNSSPGQWKEDVPSVQRGACLSLPLSIQLSDSAECVKILCEHYKISQAGHHAPSHFQLFLLNFFRLHHLVLKFFLR